MTEVLAAAGLRVTLGGATILHDVDLTVSDGEVVGLLGANGSGKSTLVRALVGVVPAERGTVRLLGEPLGRRTPWDRIGYVPQRVAVASGVPATAREVVVSGMLHGRRLVPPRHAGRRAAEALELVGLGHLAHRACQELSGGQQQRVLIARALVRRPDLLLLDEPVAGVDLPSQEAFARALADLRTSGTTVVVVLHELGALAPLVRRAVVLRHGSVVHDGAPPAPAPGHAAPSHDHVHPHGGEDASPPDALGLSTVGWSS
ncbi:ABC transporter ATP-binding protein [Actinotalea ferrariae CF5-4]|uniref:ABC transporter ATP-binding protein n=1 Tax=Actinotalea ferrariae CF5-4 TaxID=948458 RepID=A0A021VRK2_9CELL|nr:ATP-binding cassette domain-containing protein [Actinotalea ferrariae]EYR63748.1 ABC transporter ATP-binding protein [Actinotalea ferrariae CF5-4]